MWGVERGVWGVVERGMWGGRDLCLLCQAWRVVGESGGGIGIVGEPGGCGEGDLGGGGSLPISPSKESCGREWRGNWYCRGTCTL